VEGAQFILQKSIAKANFNGPNYECLARVQSNFEFNEKDLDEHNSINIELNEFFKSEYANATKDRVISGNIRNTNPFGF